MPKPHLFQWREALLSPEGPTPSTRRYVLLALSLHANRDGGDCFPSTRRLAEETGMSRRRVEGHLRGAEAEGWIRREQLGGGQGWRRMRYAFAIPGGAPIAEPELELATKEGDAPAEPEHTSDPGTFPPLAQLPRNGTGREYPAAFEGAFRALPPRHRGHPKAPAYKAWRARVQDGVEPSQLEAAALAYAEEARATQKAGTEFVLMGSTFFGPDERWLQYSGIEPTQNGEHATRFGPGAGRIVQ